jgi:hypothetical protein
MGNRCELGKGHTLSFLSLISKYVAMGNANEDAYVMMMMMRKTTMAMMMATVYYTTRRQED